MKFKFTEILKEDRNSTKKSKYINMLVNMMKDHFTEPEGGLITWSTDWINNTNIGDYKNKIIEFIEVNNQMTEIHNKLSDVIKLTPKQIYELGKQKRELTEKWENLYNHIRHIYELFKGADENNFINEYGLNLSILLEVWEKFYEEVYKPARVEDTISKSNFGGVQHGLPQGNYSEDKKLNSVYGIRRYSIFTDKDNGDYILGIDKEWSWFKKGIQLDNLYYKRYNSLEELEKDLHNIETKLFIKENDSYLDSDDLKDLIEHIGMSNINDIKDDWREEKKYDSDLTFEEFLGDEINRYLMDEKGMGYDYLSNNSAETLARNYIKLDKIINDIYNL